MLYNENFNVLNEADLEMKRIIDEKYSSPFPLIRLSGALFEYPKSIRHNQSLFPNYYLDYSDLRDTDTMNNQIDLFSELLKQKSTNETDIKNFILHNRSYFIIGGILCYFSFGHHEAYLFPEFRLGNEFRADYLLIGKSSDGYQYVFVEMQDPYKRITIRQQRYFGDQVREGINQVNEWKGFLERKWATEIVGEFDKLKKPDAELCLDFLEYDSTRVNYCVVSGTRPDFSRDIRRLKRTINKENNILLIHHDNLIDRARDVAIHHNFVQ